MGRSHVDGWGKQGDRARIRAEWDPFEEMPSLPSATIAVAPPSWRLADDLLSEIDGVLSQQDFLVGYWQAPGE